MTGPEFKAALATLGISQRSFAERIGAAPNTVNRWCSGELIVPGYARYIVDLLREIPAR